MNTQLAARARSLKQSEIRAMTIRAVEQGGVNLAQGLCELPTPDEVKEAACQAIRDDCNTYAPLNGKPALRKQIAAIAKTFNRIDADPENEITLTSGATGAYTCALLALLEVGERVINFEPFYGYHVNLLRTLGFEPVFSRMEPPGWEIDFGGLKKMLADGARAIVINTPANPSGKVFSRDELLKIGELCAEYGAWVITDEIYEYITFDGHEHVSMASLPGMFERTVTVSGFSKTLAMTGWRLGWASGPAEVIGKMALISDLLYICAPHPLQEGVSRALEALGKDYFSALATYDTKRRLLSGALEKAGFRPLPLQGTYFMLAGYGGIYGDISSTEAMERLFTEHKIASVPAASFFSGGHDQSWLRLCFAVREENLNRAVELLGSS
ncbi:MAG: aminotransferase class I/II-fold pyridoxal phosphate-dependent enzyme [Candidatus Glassbacteria bacterium]|nr:aminotransferase class I/II-fold pyridoxal phosphate-dependent enzyme [Candidatus Glassbacteria bacterium]